MTQRFPNEIGVWNMTDNICIHQRDEKTGVWNMPKFLLQKCDVWNMSHHDGCANNSWNMLFDDNRATDSCTDSESGIERLC